MLGFKHRLGFAALAMAALGGVLIASPANAHLIFEGVVDTSGSGLGAVPTILTLHSNTGSESGSVAYTLGGDVTTGDTTAINNTITLTSAGLTTFDGSQTLGILFNPSEPPPNSFVTLTSLAMTIYDAGTADTLFTAPAILPAGGLTLDASDTGTGTGAFLFELDTTELTQLLALVPPGGTLSFDDRIGLSASITDTQGGNETFAGTVVAISTVPEPASLAIFGAALAGLGLIRRRRRNV